MDALVVDRLTKVYGDGTRALDSLELRIPAGSFFGLLGPNGAGKTTLIGAAAGLVRAPAERLFVFGHDATRDPRARLLLGVAPQEVHLDRFLSTRDVLVYHGRYFGLRTRDARERADELLDAFDLAAKAATKPNRLSGGMRRRLLIARALVHRPRLVALDEPTAGVDLELRQARGRVRGGDAAMTADLAAAQRRGTVALAGREVRRVVSLWTQTILPPVLTAVLFLAVFGGALGSRIRSVENVDYTSFILPGLLVLTVASQTAANAATSIFQAKSEGYIEDVLMSPLRAWQIAAAYVAGALVRGLAAALAVALAAVPFVEAPEHPLVAVASLALAALIFSAVGVIVGVWADTFDQHSFVTAILITPLALVGGVFYAARTLDEPWATLTRLDPIYLVDATRYGFTGFHESPVWSSLAVAAAAAGGTLALAVGLLGRGWRLKP